MSAVTIGLAGPSAPSALNAELIDGIAEAVASPRDPHSRAEAVVSLVREAYETVEWLYGSGVTNDELASLRLVLVEAGQHLTRMSTESGSTPSP